MTFGKVFFSAHAIERYRQRVLTHKNMNTEIPKKDVISMIYRDIDYKHIKEIVSFANDYKFVFTRHSTEFIFKNENGTWILITVIRYKRYLAFEDLQNKESIFNSIKNRKKQKIEYEKGCNTNDLVRNIERS